jgi:hypothetical protein
MSVQEYINSEDTSQTHLLHTEKIMIMLTGTKAFEACWQSLQSSVASTSTDSRLLMQAMGRLVDNYATHDELIQELPVMLRDVFDRLVDAYLNGYWLETAENEPFKRASSSARRTETAEVSPAMLAAAQLRQRRKMEPTPTSEAATYIVHDPADLSVRAAFGRAFA